jgi:hypothetical protein
MRWLMKHSTDLVFQISLRPRPGKRTLGAVDGD